MSLFFGICFFTLFHKIVCWHRIFDIRTSTSTSMSKCITIRLYVSLPMFVSVPVSMSIYVYLYTYKFAYLCTRRNLFKSLFRLHKKTTDNELVNVITCVISK